MNPSWTFVSIHKRVITFGKSDARNSHPNPTLPFKMKERYSVFKPMLRFNESDIIAKVQATDSPCFLPCKYREFRPKRSLQKFYEHAGLRFDYDRVLEFAKNTLGVPDISEYATLEKHTLKNLF